MKCKLCKWYQYVNDDYRQGWVCKNKKLLDVVPALRDTFQAHGGIFTAAESFGCILFKEKSKNES